MKSLYLIIIIALLVLMFRKARRQAEQSPQRRRFIIWRAVVMALIGLPIALLLPQRVPMNNESPAGVVVYLVCWFVGGLMVMQAGISVVAALMAKPKVQG
jgi:ABC-type amino acid transport system permease subunit